MNLQRNNDMSFYLKSLLLVVSVLFANSAFATQSAKLTYILSDSRRLNIYLTEETGDLKDRAISVAMELVDLNTSQKIDLNEINVDGLEGKKIKGLDASSYSIPFELPKSDSIEGILPKGVNLDNHADLSRNLFQEGMFVYRVQFAKDEKVAVVLPLEEIYRTNKPLSFRVFEPKPLQDLAKRNFSFTLATGSPIPRYGNRTLVASISDQSEQGKTYAYGTVVVDITNGIYTVNKEWMDLSRWKNSLKVVTKSIELPEPDHIGRTHIPAYDLMNQNDKIARLSPKNYDSNWRAWPNARKPIEVQTISSYELTQRHRELQTQRIESNIEAIEPLVEKNVDFSNLLLGHPEITGELKNLGATVLNTETKLFATVRESNYYVHLKVFYEKQGDSTKNAIKEISWIVKMNHFSQEIVGVQSLSKIRSGKLQTILPGDFIMFANGKIEKLQFSSSGSHLMCSKLFQ
jgi:hypothetical protein